MIWPSVFDHDPNQKDYRTNHEALPVIKGVKYGGESIILRTRYCNPGNDIYAFEDLAQISKFFFLSLPPKPMCVVSIANAWVHQRSFKDVYAKNCA